MPLLEQLYLLPHDLCPVELRQTVSRVVIGARYNIRAEPLIRKHWGQIVLVVEDSVVDQHPVTFFYPSRPQSVCLRPQYFFLQLCLFHSFMIPPLALRLQAFA